MKPDLKTEAMKSIVRMTVAAAVLLFSAGSLAAQGPDGQKVTLEQRAESCLLYTSDAADE